MWEISDELLYALNLPLPPAFTLCQDSKSLYKVPDFFGYETASTKWIIAMLTNKSSLKRLIKCGRSYEHIFSRYYQIPDRPIEVMGNDYRLETPAYHHQSILYLTPLALALYMKQFSVVETLLELKDESGRPIVHSAEACFVQKVYKKGEKRILNEFTNTFPIIIAIRRNFNEGVGLLVENGFTLQKQFSIIYRKQFKETVSLYRDVLDYVVELLRNKPCMDATKIIKIMLDPSSGVMAYDIFVYDIELDSNNDWDYVSIFRRICRIGFGIKYFIEESATQVINILEQIQMIGYFGGVNYLSISSNGRLPNSFPKMLSEEVVLELESEQIGCVMNKIPFIIKATRKDLLQLDPTELKERINHDYQCCIGLLFLWYQRCLIQKRSNHYTKLACLLSRIMFDTKLVEEFFETSDQDLATTFSEWSQDHIKSASVFHFRIRMQDYILFTDPLCFYFIDQYGKSPRSLLNAPMLRGKRFEDSSIARHLLNLSKSNVTDSLANDMNTNQCNEHPCPPILNSSSINFIPANHARNLPLERHSGEHTRHTSLNKSFLGRRKEFNNGNSLMSTRTSSMTEQQSNLLFLQRKTGAASFGKPPIDNMHETNSTTNTYVIESILLDDALFRPKLSNEICKQQQFQSTNKKLYSYQSSGDSMPMISDDELKDRAQRLLATNEKYRDSKVHENTEKVPLKSLRLEVQKYKSVEGIIRVIQSKETTKLDCLYNNIDAISMIEIMAKLSFNTALTSSKSSNNEFSRLFQSKI